MVGALWPREALLPALSGLRRLAPRAAGDVRELRLSRQVLANCGNLSSASILAVLQLAMREKLPLERSNDALVVAIGPGLSFELSLLEF